MMFHSSRAWETVLFCWNDSSLGSRQWQQTHIVLLSPLLKYSCYILCSTQDFLHSHKATVFWLVARVLQYGCKCVLMGFKHIAVQLLWCSLLANKPTHKCLQYRLLMARYCLCPSLVISKCFCFVFTSGENYELHIKILKLHDFRYYSVLFVWQFKLRFLITCIYLAYYYMIC